MCIRRIPDKDRIGLIWIPDSARNKKVGTRRGEVIAVGKGDKAMLFGCSTCGAVDTRTPTLVDIRHDGTTGYRISATCHHCGSSVHMMDGEPARRPMHVKVGDTVFYARSPNNSVFIDDEEYTFIHEEQHILAVLEPEHLHG